jgi:serine/threonine-protein kinase
MDAERWQRVQELFHAVADIPPDARTAVLAERCRDDPTLADDVLALVATEQSRSVLDRGVGDAAQMLLDTEHLPRGPFGPYRLVGRLGEGGMGSVFRAVRDDIGGVAAIKVLRDATLSPARRERFVAEERTLARLNHSSIAALYDAGVLGDGTPWFAMEVVEGWSLTEYCRRTKAPLVERLRLFRSVCEAVQHAHRHLVIHRDLKPSNIHVRDDGSVKLLDFGIAKPLEALGDSHDRTRTGLLMLTPAYAAPEQFRGEAVGTYTDIYALGVVLYELLCDHVPYDLSDKTPGAAEALVLGGEPDRPSVVTARAEAAPVVATRAQWSDLDVLCFKAMHKDPQRRYQSVDALMRDVDRFVAHQPLEARPDAWGYRARKFLRRHRARVVTTAVVAVGGLTLVTYSAVGVARARDAALAEAARTQRVQGFLLNLFQGGDEEVGPAESLRVVTLIDRGVQEARSLGAEPIIQAELFHTLGDVYRQLGRLERADTLLRAALTQRQRTLGPDHPDVAQTVIAMSALETLRAAYDSAEALARTGLAASRRAYAEDHPQVALATDALGRVLEEKGDYAGAIAVYEEAVRLRSRSGEVTPELATSLTGLANNQFYLGNYAAADTLNRRALAMSRQLYGEQHPNVANDLINLGAVQFEQGDYVRAESLYRAALPITEGWYGPNHHATAANLTMLGRALRLQQKHDDAYSLVARALAIQERVHGPVHPRVASALNELGVIANMRERYAEAESISSRVVDIYRATYGDNHYYVGIGIANLASVYLARGDNARAERGFRDALAIYAKTLPADHSNVGIGEVKLGRSLLRQRRFSEAIEASTRGYDILTKQGSGLSWLKNARADLAAAYDSLGDGAKAKRYRAELADSTQAAPR